MHRCDITGEGCSNDCYLDCPDSDECEYAGRQTEQDVVKSEPLGDNIEQLAKLIEALNGNVDSENFVKTLRLRVYKTVTSVFEKTINGIVAVKIEELVKSELKTAIDKKINDMLTAVLVADLAVIDKETMKKTQTTIETLINEKFKTVINSVSRGDKKLSEKAIDIVIREGVEAQIASTIESMKQDFDAKMQKIYIQTLMKSFAKDVMQNKALMDSLINNK